MWAFKEMNMVMPPRKWCVYCQYQIILWLLKIECSLIKPRILQDSQQSWIAVHMTNKMIPGSMPSQLQCNILAIMRSLLPISALVTQDEHIDIWCPYRNLMHQVAVFAILSSQSYFSECLTYDHKRSLWFPGLTLTRILKYCPTNPAFLLTFLRQCQLINEFWAINIRKKQEILYLFNVANPSGHPCKNLFEIQWFGKAIFCLPLLSLIANIT